MAKSEKTKINWIEPLSMPVVEVLGREQEAKMIVSILNRSQKDNPIIMTEKGNGRLSIIQSVASLLQKKELPISLTSYDFYYLNVTKLIMSPEYSETLAENIAHQLSVENNAKILVMDNLDEYRHQDFLSQYQLLIPFIQRILLGSDTQLILLCNLSFFEHYLKQDSVIKNHCETITIDSLPRSTVVEILKNNISQIHQKYQISTSVETLAVIADLAERYISDKPLLAASLYLMDAASAFAYTQHQKQLGKAQIAAFLSQKLQINPDILLQTELAKLMDGLPFLQKQIYGHRDALEQILSTLQISYLRPKQRNHHQPVNSMIFVGENQVGKTETAKAVTNLLFGSDHYLKVINLLNDKTPSLLLDQLVNIVTENPLGVIFFNNILSVSSEMIQFLCDVLDGKMTNIGHLDNILFVFTVSVDTQNIHFNVNESESEELEEKGINLLPLVLSDLPNLEQEITHHKMPSELMTRYYQTWLSDKLTQNFLDKNSMIPFSMLSGNDIKCFLTDELSHMGKYLKNQHNITLVFDEGFIEDLLTLLPRNRYTVPNAEKFIQQKVLSAVSFAIQQSNAANQKVSKLYLSINVEQQCICDWGEN